MTSVGDDRWGVIEVVNRYAEACDSRDWSLFDSIFTPDAVGDYGAYVASGREAIVHNIRGALGGCGPSQHLLGNYDVRIAGDTATARCRVRASHVARDDPSRNFEVWGEYRDELRRTPEGWRITRRVMRVDHAMGDPGVLAPG